MQRLAIAAAVLAASLSVEAADRAVNFSRHTSGFVASAVDLENGVVVFQGRTTVRGRLYFTFDVAGDDRVDGVLFAKLVPDLESQEKLPAVVGGWRPGPVDALTLRDAERVLRMTYGKAEALRLSRGSRRVVSADVEVTIEKYATSVECDSRGYYADVVSVRRQRSPSLVLVQIGEPHGC